MQQKTKNRICHLLLFNKNINNQKQSHFGFSFSFSFSFCFSFLFCTLKSQINLCIFEIGLHSSSHRFASCGLNNPFSTWCHHSLCSIVSTSTFMSSGLNLFWMICRVSSMMFLHSVLVHSGMCSAQSFLRLHIGHSSSKWPLAFKRFNSEHECCTSCLWSCNQWLMWRSVYEMVFTLFKPIIVQKIAHCCEWVVYCCSFQLHWATCGLFSPISEDFDHWRYWVRYHISRGNQKWLDGRRISKSSHFVVVSHFSNPWNSELL